MRIKHLFPALLALLTLSACGAAPQADASQETGLAAMPETARLDPVSAPAAVTEGQAPGEDYDLSAVTAGFREWMLDNAQNPVGLLAEVPEREVALYGITGSQGDTALLRWGDSLAEFDWGFGGPQMAAPRLWCVDADNDGQEEVVLANCEGSGTGLSVYGLHIVEKGEDGTLTDYRFPETLAGEQLTALLETAAVGGRAYVVLGMELVDITDIREDLDVTSVRGLVTGDSVNFAVEDEPDSLPCIELFVEAWLDADNCAPTAWYVAEITGTVGYQDGVYTLSGLHLNSY
jgi:hypothetical protein